MNCITGFLIILACIFIIAFLRGATNKKIQRQRQVQQQYYSHGGVPSIPGVPDKDVLPYLDDDDDYIEGPMAEHLWEELGDKDMHEDFDLDW